MTQRVGDHGLAPEVRPAAVLARCALAPTKHRLRNNTLWGGRQFCTSCIQPHTPLCGASDFSSPPSLQKPSGGWGGGEGRSQQTPLPPFSASEHWLLKPTPSPSQLLACWFEGEEEGRGLHILSLPWFWVSAVQGTVMAPALNALYKGRRSQSLNPGPQGLQSCLPKGVVKGHPPLAPAELAPSSRFQLYFPQRLLPKRTELSLWACLSLSDFFLIVSATL